ncbi:MAG: hypothetical protein U9Q74_08260, partial [Gemmatimonadota bacterium]|nr:hypothetical protein [Gemmatimonadota bacterium]
QAGARHVYAIERGGGAALAEMVVRENGCEDRVTCIRGDSARVTLPERGTVLVSDLRGALPLHGDSLATIIDARQRLLVPGATMIPARDVVLAAPCDAPRDWSGVELALGAKPHGIARGALARVARATLHRDRVAPDGLLAAPAHVAEIEYATVESPDVDSGVNWRVGRDGRAEGLLLWFETALAAGVGYGTGPAGRRTTYGTGFLPFAHPLDVRLGDRIECRLRAKLVDGEYVFAWDSTHVPVAGAPVTMRQSSLDALALSSGDLANLQPGHVPSPDPLDAVRALVALTDGRRTLGQIAGEIHQGQTGRFSSPSQALGWVTRTLAALNRLPDA